jgi:hypothetical protein
VLTVATADHILHLIINQKAIKTGLNNPQMANVKHPLML